MTVQAVPCYSTFKAALQATCHAWCHEQGYTDPFCQDGVWWAFPPGGVIPVRVKDVMAPDWQRSVRIGALTLDLLANGALASGLAVLS
ncbi:MAG: hypothetical protein AAFR42_20785 [Cyanobacteria bacterium J06628_6]